ncbi:hypothetical protein Q7P36_006142 [Cladosporium allicinum]
MRSIGSGTRSHQSSDQFNHLHGSSTLTGWDGITLPTYTAENPARVVFVIVANARHSFYLFRLSRNEHHDRRLDPYTASPFVTRPMSHAP